MATSAAVAAPSAASGTTPPQLDAQFVDKFYGQVKKDEVAKLNELGKIVDQTSRLLDQTRALQNMPVKEVFARTLDTLVAVVTDLSRGLPLTEVFLAPDRIAYIGIVLIVVALAIWLVDVTS